MSKKELKTGPSRSALLTALYRAMGNREFLDRRFGSDYLAEVFLPFYARFLIKSRKMRTKGKDRNRMQMPGVYEYVLARSAFFDQLFIDALNERIPQIVILGAGYDTRAYRFAKINTFSRIIELDNAPTQDRKKKRLKMFKIPVPEQVTHASIDFNRELISDVLRFAGYEENEKTLFIWEGVCMYLDPKSVDAVLGFISRSSNMESRVAFDYVVTIADDKVHHYYGAEEIAQIMKKPRSNESFRFTIDEAKMESFLDRMGLRIVEHMNHEQMEKSFLTGEDGASIGRPNGMFRFVVASPKLDA